MKLIFLRHGESEYNVLGLCNADPAVAVALTPQGRLQAESAADRLRTLPIRRVYVSRLQRAQETAAIVNASHCADIYVDARLDDRNTGCEGLPVAHYLNTMNSASDPFSWKAPTGESYRELLARTQAFLAEVKPHGESESESGGVVLVVTHHEVLQAVAGYFRSLTLPEMWAVWVGNGETLEFELT